MSVDEAMRNSQALLEQISGQPEAVLAALDPGERVRVVDELSALAERASGVQAEADLLYVAEAVHGLIEETPALAALLLPTETETRVDRGRLKTRKLTRDYDDAAYRKSPRAQRQAAQIRNRVVECRQNLTRALQGTAKKERHNGR